MIEKIGLKEIKIEPGASLDEFHVQIGKKEKQKLLLYWKAICPNRVMKTTLRVAAAAAAAVVAVAVAVAVVRAILLAIQVLEQD